MNIGIDIGGTTIRVATIDGPENGKITNEIVFPNSTSYEDNISQIRNAVGNLATEVSFIGVSTPGSFNEYGSLMIRSTNMPHWVNKPSVTSRLSEEFSCGIARANDTESAALGEAVYGESKEPFFFISFGTGISGASVDFTDGKPSAKRVSSDVQSEFFVPWQNDCAGKSIENEFGKSGAELTDAEWLVVTDRFSSHLKLFMGTFKLRHVVFGGGVAVKQWDRLDAMLANFKKQYPEYGSVDFSLTSLGEDAALYGAFALQNIKFE